MPSAGESRTSFTHHRSSDQQCCLYLDAQANSSILLFICKTSMSINEYSPKTHAFSLSHRFTIGHNHHFCQSHWRNLNWVPTLDWIAYADCFVPFVKHRVSALPVVNKNRKLVNIYSKFDIIVSETLSSWKKIIKYISFNRV